MPTPLTVAAPSTQSTLHEWVTDSLEPVNTARAMTVISNQKNLKAILKIIEGEGLEDSVNWKAFKQMYVDLNAQFAVPKRAWWEHIPYTFGWAWRIPYGWWLKFRRAF